MPEAEASESPRELQARLRAGKALRDIGHAFVGQRASIEQIERLADVLESISAELWPADRRWREFQRLSGPERAEYPQGPFVPSFDDLPISGRASPWGLDLDLHRHGDEIEARVVLRAGHEGAPGRSHGGIVAALFDDVFGYVLGVIHQPAFTGELTVRYVAPTPLDRELSCRVRLDERRGRRLLMSGELTDPSTGAVLVRAKATFIAVDAEAFAALTAERPAPPDEDVESGIADA
jgi:acyl-coenzyme A thioesterase PaaI-like protein